MDSLLDELIWSRIRECDEFVYGGGALGGRISASSIALKLDRL